MKNFLLLVALLVGVYLYLHPAVEPAPVAVQPPPPAPVMRYTLYYHSPLDAPPMSPGNSTGSGYHSTEPASRFGTGPELGGGGTNSVNANLR